MLSVPSEPKAASWVLREAVTWIPEGFISRWCSHCCEQVDCLAGGQGDQGKESS